VEALIVTENHLYDSVFARHEDKTTPFLITEKGVYSRADFAEHVHRLGNALVRAGLRPGDRVAMQAEKSVEAFALYAATIKAGGVFLPLNTGYTAAELEYFIGDATPGVLVARPDDEEKLAPLAHKVGAGMFTLDAEGQGSLIDAASCESPEMETVPRHADDLAAILYTSGTTGRSKGAMLSHRNLRSNTEALAETWKFTEDDILLHALPIYHTHGLFVAGNLLAMTGGRMIYLPRFQIDEVLGHLPRATAMMGVPTFYTRLLADQRFTRTFAEHMRIFISGSAPLLAETHVEFEARTGQRILERYGMTETGMNTSNPYDGERRAGTVGMALTGVSVRLVDAKTGDIVTPGGIGIIEVKGDNVFSGYWQMPEKTKESFREDGYFITGDMAMEDKEGYITIVGRDKDLIISGGLNVYPKEVEEAINALPGVVESAVIGVPHPDFGEGVVAVIVPEGTVTAIDIKNGLSETLAAFKQPKEIIFMDNLPRNSMGKVQKANLRKEHAGLFRT